MSALKVEKWYGIIEVAALDIITFAAQVTLADGSKAPAKLTTPGVQRFFPVERISLVIDGIRVPVTSADCGGLDVSSIDLQLPQEFEPGNQWELCIAAQAPDWQDLDGNPFAGLSFADTIPPE